MVERCQHDIVTDECTLVNGDPSLVLELTTHVDEYSLTDVGVLTTVGMERWEHTNRFGHLTSPKFVPTICAVLPAYDTYY